MKITRMRALAVSLAACAAAGAAGTAVALGGGSGGAAEEVVNACRHPKGGWV